MRLNRQDRMVTVRIPAVVHGQLEFLADQQWCDVSSMIRSGIRRELDANRDLLEDEVLRKKQREWSV